MAEKLFLVNCKIPQLYYKKENCCIYNSTYLEFFLSRKWYKTLMNKLTSWVLNKKLFFYYLLQKVMKVALAITEPNVLFRKNVTNVICLWARHLLKLLLIKSNTDMNFDMNCSIHPGIPHFLNNSWSFYDFNVFFSQTNKLSIYNIGKVTATS